MWSLWLVGLSTATAAQTFSHFPVTTGRSDVWTAPVAPRPPGLRVNDGESGGAEALMSLLEGDSIEEEKRVVRGRMLASPTQGRPRVADQGKPAGEPVAGPVKEEQRPRGRARLVGSRVSPRGRKVVSQKAGTDSVTSTTLGPLVLRAKEKPSRGRGAGPRRLAGPKETGVQGTVRGFRTKESKISFPSQINEKQERPKFKKGNARRIKKPNKGRIQAEEKKQVHEAVNSLPFLPTVKPKKRKHGKGRKPAPTAPTTTRRQPSTALPTLSPTRQNFRAAGKKAATPKSPLTLARRPATNTGKRVLPSSTSRAPFTPRFSSRRTTPANRKAQQLLEFPKSSQRPVSRDFAARPATEITAAKKPQTAKKLLLPSRKQVNNIRRFTRPPIQLNLSPSTAVSTSTRLITTTTEIIPRRTSTTKPTTTTRTSTTRKTSTTKRITTTSPKTSKGRRPPLERRPPVTLNEAFSGRATTATTTPPSVNDRRTSPQFAVAVAGHEPGLPARPTDEAPSVLSPLDHVLSIVSMRKDPQSDHDNVLVATYDIEKALSHAELTWAADPFRKQVSPNGKPDFKIDFTKNPSGGQRSGLQASRLHEVPAGRQPVSFAFTRHLGRVETQPSANNRLRQSFAKEEARSDTSSSSPAAPRQINPASRRNGPSNGRATQRTGSFTPERKTRMKPEENEVEPTQRNDIRESKPPVTNQKTTSLEDLTWTPALLQRGFNREQFRSNVREPTNPDDVFVFFRS